MSHWREITSGPGPSPDFPRKDFNMSRLAHQRLGSTVKVGLFVMILVTGSAGNDPVSAQTEFPRLGLSAAPDAYVATIDVSTGEPFQLYVVAKGPDGSGVLPFDLLSLEWAVFAPCCGASYEILAIEYNPLLDHVGHPFTGVSSTSANCLEDDFLYLATLTFEMRVEFPGNYILPAGAIGPASDCEGVSHFFFDLTVEAVVDGGFTPNDRSTWGALKSSYR
jgi:hypothetical protein